MHWRQHTVKVKSSQPSPTTDMKLGTSDRWVGTRTGVKVTVPARVPTQLPLFLSFTVVTG